MALIAFQSLQDISINQILIYNILNFQNACQIFRKGSKNTWILITRLPPQGEVYYFVYIIFILAITLRDYFIRDNSLTLWMHPK
jgi:hypothetical protein